MSNDRPNIGEIERVEVRFVRNIEHLHEQQIFLVMRDKLEPHSLEESHLATSPFSKLRFRVAHSDSALALMVDAEPQEGMSGALDVVLQLRSVERDCQLSYDSRQGVSEGSEACHESLLPCSFSSQQHPDLAGSRLWRIVLLPLGECALVSGKRAEFSLAVSGEYEGQLRGEFYFV